MAMIGEWRSALTLLREAEAQAREGGDDAPARRDAFRSTLLASALVHLGDDLSRGNASEACAHFRSAEAASGGAEFASATVREGRARCALAAATVNGNNSPPPPLLPRWRSLHQVKLRPLRMGMRRMMQRTAQRRRPPRGEPCSGLTCNVTRGSRS